MYNETTSHLDVIVKDGTVRIPSIFMFEDWVDIDSFLTHARKMNCIVVFENEHIEFVPNDRESTVEIGMYKTMIADKKFLNAYLRYLGNIDKMGWEDVTNG